MVPSGTGLMNVREITRRAKGASVEATMAELDPYLRGWQGYFGFAKRTTC